jgi:hypothetical protein
MNIEHAHRRPVAGHHLLEAYQRLTEPALPVKRISQAKCASRSSAAVSSLRAISSSCIASSCDLDSSPRRRASAHKFATTGKAWLASPIRGDAARHTVRRAAPQLKPRPTESIGWAKLESHYKGQRWYGNTIRGAYVCEQEAERAGDRATMRGQ